MSEENFVVNFQGIQFKAQEASTNLAKMSGPLSHFWTRNLIENAVCIPKKIYLGARSGVEGVVRGLEGMHLADRCVLTKLQ
jgi:hypothetical protein